MENVQNVDKVNSALTFGREKGKTAKELAQMLGITERDVRESIEKLRKMGRIIVNLQDGSGYFLPTLWDVNGSDMSAVYAQYKSTKSRIRSLSIQLYYLEEVLLKTYSVEVK